ncbi:hypothetical protein M0654_18085 [Rhizobium sp. NTR19]|uniref:Uncharacterized protein n=1 Tax=Neorhizobium turbinariae TaxID=2937795 RepID=A0ABT0IVL1_9HYPH|nr:hypothetical protein [Neorhizobium turbinariae]MCK8781894.1 hypothetical protein [Neorhizobium turbinariae]
MTPQTSNVLPFPKRVSAPPELARPVDRDKQVAALEALGTDDRSDYVVSVIRPVICFARRKGRRLESLPPQLRVWLLDLCAAGDPTSIMVRDWLYGNPRLVAEAGEEA